MGNVPKLDAESTIWAGSPSSSWSSMKPSSMYWRSQASASSSSAPAKHEPRLDQRDQRAGRDVEPLQRALEVVADLVDQPVRPGVLGDHPLERQRVLDGAPRADHPGAQLQLVGAQAQDEVVELAGHGQRPEVGAELVDALHGVGDVALRPEDGDVDQAFRPVERRPRRGGT